MLLSTHAKLLIAKSAWTFLIVLLALPAVNSCSNAERLPGVDVPIQEMNSQLRLSLPGGAEHLKVGDLIPLVAQDLNNDPVIFSQGFGVRMFVRENQKWIPVDNDFQYPEGDVKLLPVKQQAFGAIGIVVHPVISQSAPVTITVVVEGHLQPNGQTGKQVAAYLDVPLEP